MQTVYVLDQLGKATELTEKTHHWPEKVRQCLHQSDDWIIGCDSIEQMTVITVFTFSSHPKTAASHHHPQLYSTFMALAGVSRHFHLESYSNTTAASQGHTKWLLQLQTEDFTLSHLSLINN